MLKFYKEMYDLPDATGQVLFQTNVDQSNPIIYRFVLNVVLHSMKSGNWQN